MMRYFLMILMTVALSASAVVEQEPDMVTIQLELPQFEEQPFYLWNLEQPVSDKELHCLALNVYFEARGEEPEGQFAVADVVMHRVKHHDFPNTICGVVTQGIYPSWNPEVPLKNMCQFSWYCDRKPDNPIDIEAFEAAMYVARTVLGPNYYPEVEYALYYHTPQVNPEWAEEKVVVASIGNHLFY